MENQSWPRLVKEHSALFDQTLLQGNCEFFFEIGQGWQNILEHICSDIDALTNAERNNFQFQQIKEKWGALRIYSSGGSQLTDDILERAEELSLITCDVCGVKGHLREQGWLRVRCDAHA